MSRNISFYHINILLSAAIQRGIIVKIDGAEEIASEENAQLLGFSLLGLNLHAEFLAEEKPAELEKIARYRFSIIPLNHLGAIENALEKYADPVIRGYPGFPGSDAGFFVGQLCINLALAGGK
jgi:hypothetical protein